jgi:hypothetical protein
MMPCPNVEISWIWINVSCKLQSTHVVFLLGGFRCGTAKGSLFDGLQAAFVSDSLHRAGSPAALVSVRSGGHITMVFDCFWPIPRYWFGCSLGYQSALHMGVS